VKFPHDNDLLHRFARAHGIETSYVNVDGKIRIASEQTLCALLEGMGLAVRTKADLRASCDALFANRGPFLEPVTVSRRERASAAVVRSSQSLVSAKVKVHVQCEDGSVRVIDPPKRSHHVCSERLGNELRIQLPRLPYGYHQLKIELGPAQFCSLIISAPKSVYTEHRPKNGWGVFVPVYALRSRRNWGSGDFRDFQALGAWINSLGGTILATLPTTAALLDNPFDPSPYSPSSRLFWNEFHLHVPSIPEFFACPAVQKLVATSASQRRIEGCRRRSLVDYKAEMAVKRQVLESLADFLFARDSARRRQFEQFARLNPELARYAQFRAVMDRRRSSWREWPTRLRAGNLKPGDYSDRAVQYHMYAQWCAQEQMDGISSAANRLHSLLYLDLPVGVNPNGYDAWREPALFLAGVNVGAPPDTFFRCGQDWGFAPLHPQRMREQHFRYYLDALRIQMRQAGLLRVDHVMGLHRLYCIPKGFPASDGAYVRYPAEELYALLCLESHRHHTMVAGENLGTVPPEVNQAMAAHAMNSTYVLQYEQQPNTRPPLRAPPRRSVASVNTHDMPPFAAHWQGLDISQRIRLGLLRKTNLSIERKRRRLANAALAKFLRAQHFLRKGDRVTARTVFAGCLRFLAASDAQFVLINLEDLWSETNPQNIPGTGLEQRNWMRKAQLTLEQLLACANCESLLREIDRIRRRVNSRRPLRASEFVP